MCTAAWCRRPDGAPPWNDRWLWIPWECDGAVRNIAYCPLGVYLLRLARPPIAVDVRRGAIEMELAVSAEMADEARDDPDYWDTLLVDYWDMDTVPCCIPGLDDLDWGHRGGSLPPEILGGVARRLA